MNLLIKDSFNFAKEVTTYDSSLYMAGWLALMLRLYSLNIPLHKTSNSCVSDLHNKNFYNGKNSAKETFSNF